MKGFFTILSFLTFCTGFCQSEDSLFNCFKKDFSPQMLSELESCSFQRMNLKNGVVMETFDSYFVFDDSGNFFGEFTDELISCQNAKHNALIYPKANLILISNKTKEEEQRGHQLFTDLKNQIVEMSQNFGGVWEVTKKDKSVLYNVKFKNCEILESEIEFNTSDLRLKSLLYKMSPNSETFDVFDQVSIKVNWHQYSLGNKIFRIEDFVIVDSGDVIGPTKKYSEFKIKIIQ